MEKIASAITLKGEHARFWKAFNVLQKHACSTIYVSV